MTQNGSDPFSAQLRIFQAKVKEKFALAKAEIDALGAENSGLRQRLQELENRDLNIENLAGKRVPYRYQIDIGIPIGSSSIHAGTVTVSRDGPFIARRLLVSFRIKTVKSGGNGDWIGRYLPLSSRPVYPWMDYWHVAGTEAYNPPLDFEWAYSDGGSDRNRQDKFISGDILARRDEDGVLMVDEIFAAGATINFTVQPLRPVGQSVPWNEADGVDEFEFSAIFDGYKIVQPLTV